MNRWLQAVFLIVAMATLAWELTMLLTHASNRLLTTALLVVSVILLAFWIWRVSRCKTQHPQGKEEHMSKKYKGRHRLDSDIANLDDRISVDELKRRLDDQFNQEADEAVTEELWDRSRM